MMARQKMIEGTVDEVPKVVQAAADAYLKFKRAIANNREKMNAALDALILRMHEADVTEILVDDGDKRLVLSTKELVKVQKRKKAANDADDDAEV
jgi:hypothetical protein